MRNKTKGWLMLLPLISALFAGYVYAIGGLVALAWVSVVLLVSAWVIKAIDLILTRDD